MTMNGIEDIGQGHVYGAWSRQSVGDLRCMMGSVRVGLRPWGRVRCAVLQPLLFFAPFRRSPSRISYMAPVLANVVSYLTQVMHTRTTVRIGALSLTFIASTWMAACTDRKESRYSTVADAEHNGAFERGWLPHVMPRSATNIRELHDVDTNEGWGTFSVRISDSPGFAGDTSGCRPVSSPITVRGAGVAWWPEYLSGGINQADLRRHGLEVVECRGGRVVMYVAINRKTGTGYFWHTR
jgi:hypothetical protein